VQGATQARMKRELAEALDVLTADTPLVLVLEDLHWSDSATVELLVYLAQRRAPARLLVLGTYRPVETVLQSHPLRGIVQELCGRSQAADLRLEFLPAADVTAYMARRLGGPVAAGLQCSVEDVEARCEALATQHHFIDDTGLAVWPDGIRGGRYRFQHALYQQVLYEQIGAARRMQLHRHIGVCLEAGYGAQAGEIAAQLAIHFERGGEVERAIRYLQQAADNAARRNAHHEAVTALTKGLALLETLPHSPARAQHELTLLLTLGPRLMAVKGYAVPAVGESYTRAHTLCQQVGEPRQRCQALQGLYRFHLIQAQLRMAGELSQQFFRLASHQHDMTLVQEGYMDLGLIAFYGGDPFTARAHLEQSLRLSDTPQFSTPLPHRDGSGVRHGFYGAMVLWLLGYTDQAQQWRQEELARARQVEHTPSLASSQLFAAILSQ